MAKKIMILCGSPRKKGNTNTLVGWVSEGATEAGAEVEIVDATNLQYNTNGCTACMGCQKSEKFECVIEDEARDVLRRVGQADVLAFATPVYFFGPTAQLKLLIDRMFSLVKVNPADGSVHHVKEDPAYALVATSGGDMSDGLGLVEQTFETLAGFTGGRLEKLLVPNAPQDPAETASNGDLKNRALALGRKLAHP
jgi:multimeric flavodoxin WrbA